MKKANLLVCLFLISFNSYPDSRYYFLETLLEIESMLSGEPILDYKKPRSKGGRNSGSNVQVLSREQNRRKSNTYSLKK